MKKRLVLVTLSLALVLVANGCAVIFQKGRRSDLEKISVLEEELARLRSARSTLEQRLAGEIDDRRVSVSMEDRGLVITFVAEVLFNSGKAKLRTDSYPILDKVARILREEVPNNYIGIEGHTDNEPIRRSKWTSNWELSSQRALSVLHYLEDTGVTSERLSAVGYGEYRPVVSNDTSQGMQTNRRVEVVIFPSGTEGISKQDLSEYEEEELK